MTSLVNDGLDHAQQLQPGHLALEVMGGATQDMAFGRAQLSARITESITGFGFGQVQKDFKAPRAEVMAGGGLRWDF